MSSADIVTEHSAQGVRCFALHPGGIGSTDMGQTAPAWLKPYLTDTSQCDSSHQTFRAARLKPLTHTLSLYLADLAAGSCLYLSTARADYLQGRYVSANWDLEELEGKKEAIMTMDLLKTRVALV